MKTYRELETKNRGLVDDRQRLAQQVTDLAFENGELSAALENMAHAHDFYDGTNGPCPCPNHVEARRLLTRRAAVEEADASVA